jgi:hypothetical protein
MVGRAKEKMLMSKMISILTPVKDIQLTSDLTDITFENLLIFLATISNIEIPYNDDVKQEMMQIKKLSERNGNKSWQSDKNISEIPVGNGFPIENVSEKSNLEMKMSLSQLQNLLPARESQLIEAKSKYKYGYFNHNKTIIFTEPERVKLRKEFMNFSSNRRDFIANQRKSKAENKKLQILHEFDYVPKINNNGPRNASVESIEFLDQPIYDHLITKGKEYQMKKKIKIDLEKSLDTEECTFRPELNLISIELGSNCVNVILKM